VRVCVCIFVCLRVFASVYVVVFVCWCNAYGVASVSRIVTIIGLFCKRALLKRQYSANETYNLIDPTDCSHPIS